MQGPAILRRPGTLAAVIALGVLLPPAARAATYLFDMEGTGAAFTDISGLNHTVGVNGDTTQTTLQAKVGAKSARFDGSGDFLSLASGSDLSFGTGNYTIDFWMLSNSARVEVPVAQWDASGAPGSSVQLTVMGNGTVRSEFASGSTNYLVTGTTDVRGAWHHVAQVRNGATVSLYVDGISEASSSVGAASANSSADPFLIGRYGPGPGTFDFTGYIDMFRVTKGTALWTSNFTAPTTLADYGLSVPEPGLALMGLAGAAGVIARRRRASAALSS